MKKHEKETNELKNLENQLKRALADYQNLEKRIEQEKANWIKLANKGLILKILPVLDDLTRANEHLKDEGITLIIQKLNGILSQEGVKEVVTKGMQFNPELMDAVGTTEGEEGRVIEEITRCYKMNDEVIRHAQVVVGKQNS